MRGRIRDWLGILFESILQEQWSNCTSIAVAKKDLFVFRRTFAVMHRTLLVLLGNLPV